MIEKNWHNLSINKIIANLKTSLDGLSQGEAKNRLKKFGYNELPRKSPLSKAVIFFNQFKSALVFILLIAAGVSFFLGEMIDSYVIFAAVLLNVVIGFFQENKAQNALFKLREVIITQAKVIREGGEHLIGARELVPGDIVILTAGDRVPADVRLIEVNSFEVEEASLTGESVPVEKNLGVLKEGVVLAERKNMAYQGTVVLRGKARAVVVVTRQETEMGKIAKQLKETVDEKTPLQKKLGKFSRQIAFFILAICLLIFIVGTLSGQPALIMFNTVVAIAVSAIPEGLLVSITVILAIGMQAILRRKSLVRKLISAETLGSTTVICTDKTGTLTTGKMRVTHIEACDQKFSFSNINTKKKLILDKGILQTLKIGLLCNEAVIENEADDYTQWKIIGGATDKALLFAAVQTGMNKKQLEKEMPLIDELPFDSTRKFMISLRKYNNEQNIIYIKGAPEILLENSNYLECLEGRQKINSNYKQKIISSIDKLSNKELRMIGLGYLLVPKNINKIEEVFLNKKINNLTWVGFMGIKDPIRPDVKETIRLAEKAGLKIVIITGDNRVTARSIAEELGIKVTKDNILDGKELLNLNDKELKNIVRKIKIYSRVTPADKLRIIDAWSACGEVVAMTGDGINDAPALKRADIGIALGSGTEVAKETADLVLLDDNFSTIIAAIEQGRIIYDNIKKVVLYLLSDSFSEILIILGSFAMGLPLPFLPAQILWVNLVADSLPNLALTVEKGEKDVMLEKPQVSKTPILDKERKILITLISLVTGLGTLFVFYIFWKQTGDIDLARTIAFTALAVDSLLYVFSCRSLRRSIFNKQFFSNIYLIGAVMFSFVLQLLAIYWKPLQGVLRTKPLNLEHWTYIILISLIVIFIIETVKRLFFTHKKLTRLASSRSGN